MPFNSYIIFVIAIAAHFAGASAKPETDSVNVELILSEDIFVNAPFKQCHASSLVELTDGKIMAVWFGGTRERDPDVCIWGSVKSSDGWSNPVLLADGVINDTLRYPCWNPVLFMNGKGKLFLFYKTGPSPDSWRGLYKKSDDYGKTWSEPVILPHDITGPVKNKPISLPDGKVLCPSSVERGAVWNVHMEISDDCFKRWTRIPVDSLTGYRLIQPTLLKLHDGSILALMRSDQNYIVESRSEDNGVTWSRPVKTDIMNPNSGIDAVTLKNGLHVLIYNPEPGGKDWSDGRNRLFVMASSDGKIWYNIYKLEDHLSGEYSYPAVIQTSDGLVHITYTSNRTTIKHVVLKITAEL